MTAVRTRRKRPAAKAKKRSVTSLADQLGISRQELHKDINRGCPTDSVEAAKKWRREHKRPRFGGPKSEEANGHANGNGDVQQIILVSQAMLKREQAREAKMLNDEREGNLWPAATIIASWRQAIHVLRARLETIPDAVAQETPADWREQIHELIDNLIRLALTELENTPLGPQP